MPFGRALAANSVWTSQIYEWQFPSKRAHLARQELELSSFSLISKVPSFFGKVMNESVAWIVKCAVITVAMTVMELYMI